MIISQILLSLFLGYWLYTQFVEKKELLGEEIERGLRNAEEQLIDSILAANYINPILQDTANFSVFIADSLSIKSAAQPITMEVKIDTVAHMAMRISDKPGEDSLLNKIMLRNLKDIDSSKLPSNQNIQSIITVSAEQKPDDQLLYKGVRLLINSVGKFNRGEQNMHMIFASGPDTLLLKSLFGRFIEENFGGFTVNWQAENESSLNKKTALYFNSFLFEDEYGVSLTGYFPYLTKSMIPQIAFALILLLFTILASRMAYVSLKNQRKLISLKNDFISNITHELKTPVSTIKVSLEALLDFNLRKDPERTKEYLEIAHNEMNRLDLLVNQVLNNSAFEDGNSFIAVERIDLVSLVNEVLLSMQPRFDKQTAAVIFNAAGGEIMVNADKLHLHGVIVNLLDNSLKYTDQRPEINIELNQDDAETRLSVSDNGIGIPDEYIDKIFDKFFRVPMGNRHNVKGYGLGLNYAALVLQHHGGKIKVECNKKKPGCTFTLIFP